MNANNLIKLAEQIADERVRKEQTSALQDWLNAAPKRGRLVNCPGCGDAHYDKQGRLCAVCMETIIRAQITACAPPAETTGKAVEIRTTAHHNERIPYVMVDRKIATDDRFYRGVHDRSESSGQTFQRLVTELLAISLKGMPTPQPGMSTENLFGGYLYSTDREKRVAGIAPVEFRDAVLDLIDFVDWLVTSAKAEGYEEGTNLLVQLASGTLTMDSFTEKQFEMMRRTEERLERLQKGKG